MTNQIEKQTKTRKRMKATKAVKPVNPSEVVLYTDEKEVFSLMGKIESEVRILNSALSAWPTDLVKPATLAELVELFNEPVFGLAVKRYKLKKNPNFLALGVPVETLARTVELSIEETALANTVHRHNNFGFKHTNFYSYDASAGVTVNPDTLEWVRSMFTVTAKSVTELKLKEAAEEIAQVINKVALPRSAGSAYDNLYSLINLDIVDGKVVASVDYAAISKY